MAREMVTQGRCGIDGITERTKDTWHPKGDADPPEWPEQANRPCKSPLFDPRKSAVLFILHYVPLPS